MPPLPDPAADGMRPVAAKTMEPLAPWSSTSRHTVVPGRPGDRKSRATVPPLRASRRAALLAGRPGGAPQAPPCPSVAGGTSLPLSARPCRPAGVGLVEVDPLIDRVALLMAPPPGWSRGGAWLPAGAARVSAARTGGATPVVQPPSGLACHPPSRATAQTRASCAAASTISSVGCGNRRRRARELRRRCTRGQPMEAVWTPPFPRGNPDRSRMPCSQGMSHRLAAGSSRRCPSADPVVRQVGGPVRGSVGSTPYGSSGSRVVTSVVWPAVSASSPTSFVAATWNSLK